MLTRRSSVWTGARLLAAGAALAAVMAGVLTPTNASAASTASAPTAAVAAAAPAAVAVRSGWFGIEGQGKYCIDGNAKGQVYGNPCQVPGNHYQDWNWTEWQLYSPYSGYYYVYSIHSQATGRCLDSNAQGQIYTNPCQAPGNAYQDWYWKTGDYAGVSKFMDVATSRHIWFDFGTVDTADQPAYNNFYLVQS